MTAVQDIKGLGPFGAELVVLRGANTTDTLPHHEHRLTTVIDQMYGADQALAELSLRWRPFRTWAALHLRVLGERPADGSGCPGGQRQLAPVAVQKQPNRGS